MLNGSYHDHGNDDQQQQDWYLVEPAVVLVAACIAALFKVFEHATTGQVIDHKQRHAQQFGMHPALASAQAVAHEQPEAKNKRQYGLGDRKSTRLNSSH